MHTTTALTARGALCIAACLWLGVAATGWADSGDVAYDARLQWNLDVIDAETAWAGGRGEGIVIAVIDSGVALEHEDLQAKLVNGVACRNTDGDPNRCTGSPADDDGHGTHVAGIAAAATGNTVGVAGTAPEAMVMPIKVLFRTCPTCESTGTAPDVSAAVRWAAERGADVINLSLGSTSSTVFGPGLAGAVADAWALGAITVVAAGNGDVLAADLADSPAVVVAATSRTDTAPAYGDTLAPSRWAVSAPGGDGDDTAETCSQDGQPRGILSTYWAPDEQRSAYACLAGTSMAAPHVSGALAVLLSAGATKEQAVDSLLTTAVDLGPAGRDDVFGSGRIDLAAAMRALPDPAIAPAASTDTGTGSPGPVGADGAGVPPPGAAAPGSPEVGAPVLFVTGTSPDPPLALVLVAAAAIAATATATAVAFSRLR